MQCGQVATISFGFTSIQGGDILIRKLPIEIFIAGPARAVAGAALLLAQHGEVNPGVIEQLHESARRLLRLRIVARRAAHPEQNVRLRVLIGSLHVQARSPVHALVMIDAPGILARSMPRNAVCNCAGNSPSIITWCRRMSMMSSIGSSCTGQTSMHAPQVVQAHAASGESANCSSGFGLAAPASKPGMLHVWLISFNSIRLLISSADGLSDLPVAVAGQTSWQRLHWMQA
jgi:hypothetical protein